MTVDVIPYEPWHLETMKLKACHRGERPSEVRGYAVTFSSKGLPLAIFGRREPLAGIYHIWGLLSEDIEYAPLAFHKACLKFLAFLEVGDKVRRIQIDVRMDYAMGHRWAKALGFVQEGLMQKYNWDGSDAILFARVK